MLLILVQYTDKPVYIYRFVPVIVCVGKGGNSVARSYATHYSPILPLRELDCLKMR